jgi:hypothetical protein
VWVEPVESRDAHATRIAISIRRIWYYQSERPVKRFLGGACGHDPRDWLLPLRCLLFVQAIRRGNRLQSPSFSKVIAPHHKFLVGPDE